jgi:hypothetical protein
VNPIVILDPGRLQGCHGFQRLPLGHDETAVADRFRSGRRNVAPEIEGAIGGQFDFAVIDLITQIGDQGVQLTRDLYRKGGDEVAGIAELALVCPLSQFFQPSHAAEAG